MDTFYNDLGQPVGAPLPDWRAPQAPPRVPLMGRTCRLEPLDPALHGSDLFRAFREDREGAMWTYLPSGPFAAQAELDEWLSTISVKTDPLFFTIVSASTNCAVGLASYLRIDPGHGCIEVGHLAFSPALQRTTASTEAMYLMMRQAFELGYRRYEWKCNALNAPSCRAAERLGFTYEGLFRQAIVVKGRNRDTAWYSVIDNEWPRLKTRFEAWLDPTNFDSDGRQISRLS